MPSKKIKNQARRAIHEIASTHWAIEPSALTELIGAVDAIYRSGDVTPSAIGVSAESYTSKTVIEGDRAIIPISGIIRPRPDFFTKYLGATACLEITRDFKAALADDEIATITFLIDSPGGSVTLVEETAAEIFAGRGVKPIEAVVVGQMASAAYYLGSAADRIIAGPSSLVGSIGTVVMHADYSEYYAELGIKVTAITHGKHKADGNPYEPLSAQGRGSIQAIVDAFGAQFDEAVARHRGVTVETVKTKFGGGRQFIAAEALNLGMIDSVGQMAGGVLRRSAERVESRAELPAIEATPKTSERTEPKNQTESKPVEKIKALLYGLGLIASIDASDETATAAVTAFCRARGVELPTAEGGGLIETKVVSILTDSKPAAATANPVQAAHDRETAEAVAEMTATQYRQRRDDVEAVAALVNQGRDIVSAEDIRAAIDSDKPVAEIQKAFAGKLTASPEGTPVNVPITGGVSGEEKFAETAVLALLDQCGKLPAAQRPAGGFGDLGGMNLIDVAAESLRLCSGDRRQRVSMGNREQIASEALQMGDHGRRVFGVYGATSPAYNRPGDFPTLMSNLANRILDNQIMMAGMTFDRWTNRMADADDLKPSTVVATGSFDTLDDVGDGEDFKDLPMSEEVKGFIAVNRKGNAVKLTPVMVANNDIDGFMTQLSTLQLAHDNTLNYLCLEILFGNPTMPDGTAMFDSTRSNLVASGGAPSAAQAKKVRDLMRRQKGVGTNKTIRALPNVILVPTEHSDAADQTYAPFGRLPEIKNPATDATLNVHRGTAEVIVEPDMETFSSGTAIWYAFDTRLRTIVHRFMTGYGRGGRRSTWYNPNNDCRSYGVEGRFNAAAVGWRGAVKNPGS